MAERRALFFDWLKSGGPGLDTPPMPEAVRDRFLRAGRRHYAGPSPDSPTRPPHPLPGPLRREQLHPAGSGRCRHPGRDRMPFARLLVAWLDRLLVIQEPPGRSPGLLLPLVPLTAFGLSVSRTRLEASAEALPRVRPAKRADAGPVALGDSCGSKTIIQPAKHGRATPPAR